MKMTAQEYARRVKKVGPHSPLGTDCLWAFGVGGGICLLGEVLRQRYLALGLEADLAGTLTSCTLIALSAVLTTLGLYQKLAARAGAGSLDRSSSTAPCPPWSTAGCSGCWAAERFPLQYAQPGAKIAPPRRILSIPQNSQKNSPERRNF